MLSHRKLKRILFALIIYLVVSSSLNLIYDYITNYDELIFNLHKNNLKAVQLLTYRFDYKHWKLGHGLGLEPFRHCPEKRCYAFKPIMFQRACEKADGIMVHGLNLFTLPNRKTYKRSRKQLWLYYSLESQSRSYCSSHYKLSDLDDWFNITATFKLDSTLLADYREFRTWNDLEINHKYLERFKKELSHYRDPSETVIEFSNKNEFIDIRYEKIPSYKRATVVWYVSHCETMSRREEYVKEMRKYIYVDVYGACSEQVDPCKREPTKTLKYNCMNEILTTYKFHLSFENCLCQDYVTEKYWQFYDANRIFKVNILPVVRGAQEEYYKKMSPPNSYINAQLFKSPKDLAEYLIYLNENDTAYLEYFKWKVDLFKRVNKVYEREDAVVDNWNVSTEYHLRAPFCELCSLLHNQTYMSSTKNKIWYLSKWFSKRTDCWDQEEPRYILDRILKFFGFCI